MIKSLESDTEPPLVSVIVPTFNCVDFLVETMNSILAQSHRNLEVIVVDDGSTDGTDKLFESFRSDRILYVRTSNSGGPSTPRNIGLTRARGKYIAIFDSDDLMEKDKISRSIDLLESNQDCAFLFTDFSVIDEQGGLICARFHGRDDYQEFVSFSDANAVSGRRTFGPETLLPMIARNNFVGTSSVVMHRRIVDDGYRFDEQLKNRDDWLMWVRILKRYSSVYEPTPLHKYRRRKGSLTDKPNSTVYRNRLIAAEIARRETENTPYLNEFSASETRYRSAYANRLLSEEKYKDARTEFLSLFSETKRPRYLAKAAVCFLPTRASKRLLKIIRR